MGPRSWESCHLHDCKSYKVPRLHHAFTTYERAGRGADLEPKVKHAPATRFAIEDHEHLVYEAVSF
jgi:hypothetical protein